MLQKPPTQQSMPYATSTAPAIGAYKSATASRQSHAVADRTRFCLFLFTRIYCYPIIPHLDASSSSQVVKVCERPYPCRLDLPAPASQTNFMAHTYLLFDFGTDEEKAQLARQRLERWKQAFRLDKKLQYKLERPEDEAKDEPEHAHEAAATPKAEKPKTKSKAKHKSKDTDAAEETPVANGKVNLLVRLYFSGHEKLTEQRWLDRIPAEEPFKEASPRVIHHGEAQFDEVDKQFESLG